MKYYYYQYSVEMPKGKISTSSGFGWFKNKEVLIEHVKMMHAMCHIPNAKITLVLEITKDQYEELVNNAHKDKKQATNATSPE